MRKKRLEVLVILFVSFSICFFLGTVTVNASGTLLKQGMRSSTVTTLQNNLKKLGYFSTTATGYYGEITVSAVKRLQRDNGLYSDGIAGTKTLTLISKLLDSKNTQVSVSSNTGAASVTTLKKGMSGNSVSDLQSNLKKLGFFSANVTGYYGDITVAAVRSFQKSNGLGQDGIAGRNTFSAIDRVLTQKGITVARSGDRADTTAAAKTEGDYLVSWFGGAERIFGIGTVATVYDIDTGLSFSIKRTYGYNHADSETLTLKDTQTMKKIFGGGWNWNRRAVIITVGERKLAASIAGMPHAGVDSRPANSYVSSRSGGYGGGTNLDAVKGNGMDGVFDVHFLGSKTHGTNRVNQAHQDMVKKAAKWAAKNNY